MATYVIGDIQGCYTTLKGLLTQISFSPKHDHIWIAGDLVNRGSDSLQTLRWAKSLDSSDRVILGNHEIHLLAVYYGIQPLRKYDTIHDIVAAADAEELISWLRTRKLIDRTPHGIIIHAGFAPSWDLTTALELSERIEALLQGQYCKDFLSYYFDRTAPMLQAEWSELATALHIITHIRSCKRDGTLNTEFTGTVDKIPKPYRPWYEFAHKSIAENRVFFGHWAAHGFRDTKSFVCLDSGCVWGGWLTAYRLDDGRAFHRRSMEAPRVINSTPI